MDFLSLLSSLDLLFIKSEYSDIAKQFPNMKHDDWASYIGIFTGDSKKRLNETRRNRNRKIRKANMERRERIAAKAAAKASRKEAASGLVDEEEEEEEEPNPSSSDEEEGAEDEEYYNDTADAENSERPVGMLRRGTHVGGGSYRDG